jgi:hypothetical protein
MGTVAEEVAIAGRRLPAETVGQALRWIKEQAEIPPAGNCRMYSMPTVL